MTGYLTKSYTLQEPETVRCFNELIFTNGKTVVFCL